VVDYILDTANKVKWDPVRQSIQVRNTTLPGKPYVVVNQFNPMYVVTVMIPKEINLG
jgi:hypothetical protein